MNISNFQHFRILPPNSNLPVIVHRVDTNTLTLQREEEDRKDKIDQESLQQLLGNGWRVMNVYALVGEEPHRVIVDGFSLCANALKLRQGEAVSFKMQPEISAVLIDINGAVSAIHTVTGPDVAVLDAARKLIRQDGATWERKVLGERWYRSDRPTHMLHSTEHMAGMLRSETVVVTMFQISEYRVYLEKVIEAAQERSEELIAERRETQEAVQRLEDDIRECATRIITTRKVLEGLGQ